MAEPTKADLIAENEQLRARVDELEAQAGGTGGMATRPTPTLPSFTLSAGTVSDVLRARREIQANPRMTATLVVEPFTGRSIYVSADETRWDGADGEPVEVPGLPRAETTFEDDAEHDPS